MDPGDGLRRTGLYATGSPGELQVFLPGGCNCIAAVDRFEEKYHFSAEDGQYNADPELAKTFAVADIYGNAQGESEYTRDEITCPWNGKISILASGGLTITFRD